MSVLIIKVTFILLFSSNVQRSLGWLVSFGLRDTKLDGGML